MKEIRTYLKLNDYENQHHNIWGIRPFLNTYKKKTRQSMI